MKILVQGLVSRLPPARKGQKLAPTVVSKIYVLLLDLTLSVTEKTPEPFNSTPQNDNKACLTPFPLCQRTALLYRPFPGRYEVNGVSIWIVNPEFSVAIFWPRLHFA